MEIRSFDRIDSTQRYIVEAIKQGTLKPPCAVKAKVQYDGIGSRDNRWEGAEGNFFASFALSRYNVPADLPMTSASIYFSWLMRQTLHQLGVREVWVKWPNDFYVGEYKVGGTITQLIEDHLVWGIGLNNRTSVKNFASLKTPVDTTVLFDTYVERLKKLPLWKEVFREYKIEFELSKRFESHTSEGKVDLKDAVLCEDGSLIINGRKVYSRR